ncbi:MAG: alpha-amylase family glycosyl hydrolase, partial [Planctomycetota bacterium]
PADAAARMRAIRGLIDPERPPLDQAVAVATGEELRLLMDAHLPQLHVVTLDPPLQIWADREKAGFSAWYEMFPRSASPDPNRHGTLGDLTKRLPYVASMGFDVLYLPPIHPIGRTKRKGRNNAITCDPGDVGSPWAIGAAEGGHKSIHPDLGDERDFAALIKEAERLDIEIALDVALQCSPDHPYVREHPEWFRHRPDGSIQYAENPPKKYEDIYPIDFECQQWEALWAELRSIFDHWIERGVRIFRVDNPHTKSFTFWEWLAAGLRRDHPDVLLLAEAFTRPKVMHRLAKIGFHQSYTYFTWRNDAWSLQQYMHELTQQPPREFFRPNFWSNTPDILSEYVQHGGRSGSVIRLILAATLSANYGIYGPPFELVRTEPRPGKEEYIDNEKYEVHHWDLTEEHSLSDLIALVNRIRRANPALQQTNNITFHNCDNPAVLCFSKQSDDGVNTILCAVNTDPHHTQWANLDLNMPALGLDWHDSFQAHDLLSGARYAWQGQWNTVALHPHSSPAHILRVRRHGRTEHDFEYFV